MRIALAALAALTISTATAARAETFEEQAFRLCNSTQQDVCWIKAITPLCKRSRSGCRDLPEDTPAQVLERRGDLMRVHTDEGDGYVPFNRIVLDGSK